MEGGDTLQWIGATIQARTDAVVFGVPRDKGAEVFRELRARVGRPVVPLRALLRAAGRVSIYAGLVPVLRAFLSQLWTAFAAEARLPPGTTRVVHAWRVELGSGPYSCKQQNGQDSLSLCRTRQHRPTSCASSLMPYRGALAESK